MTMTCPTRSRSKPIRRPAISLTSLGKPTSSWLPRYFDHCYNNQLDRAGVLQVVKRNPNGGQTCFAYGMAIYRARSPELRKQVEGLSIIYSMDMQPNRILLAVPRTFGFCKSIPTDSRYPKTPKSSPGRDSIPPIP